MCNKLQYDAIKMFICPFKCDEIEKQKPALVNRGEGGNDSL